MKQIALAFAFFMALASSVLAQHLKNGQDVREDNEGAIAQNTYCVNIFTDPEKHFKDIAAQKLSNCLNENSDFLSLRTDSGQTLMHLAARYANDPSVLILLAELGLSVGEIDNDRNTPLHLAVAREDYKPLVATLLAIGADKEAVNLKDQRAFALQEKNYPDIRALLLPDDMNNKLLLTDLIEDGRGVECDNFLSPEFFQTRSPSNILFCANRSRPTASNKDGNTALHLAAQHATNLSPLNALLLSLDQPEDIEKALNAKNLAGYTPLHLSAKYSSVPGALAWLVVWGADVDAMVKPQKSWNKLQKYGTTALHYAAFRRDEYQYFAVEELLAMGADVLLQDRERPGSNADQKVGRQTALHYAAINKQKVIGTNKRTVRVLLRAEFAQSSGLNPVDVASGWEADEIKDTKGQTALHYAAYSNVEPEVIYTLLDNKFNLTLSDDKGQTPLLLYAKTGTNTDVMLKLISRAMMPGKTSVMLGSLLQEKAVCKTDKSGLSAMAYIRQNQNLNKIDPSGASETPQSKIVSLCSK
ncbi:ankyrin repeat domain-containing protein [Pseudopelagicola sp. nBUS_20]|uniref:ankyrin repeat domain-containing protein n=1 Tax=Pseudopelagicola sp. nBUS_20 TaxID=3395317 RepID=UPI003EBE05C6